MNDCGGRQLPLGSASSVTTDEVPLLSPGLRLAFRLPMGNAPSM